jgi:hypothetical protein
MDKRCMAGKITRARQARPYRRLQSGYPLAGLRRDGFLDELCAAVTRERGRTDEIWHKARAASSPTPQLKREIREHQCDAGSPLVCIHVRRALSGGDPVEATKLEGKSTRPGVYKCRPCSRRRCSSIRTSI